MKLKFLNNVKGFRSTVHFYDEIKLFIALKTKDLSHLTCSLERMSLFSFLQGRLSLIRKIHGYWYNYIFTIYLIIKHDQTP